MNYAEFKKSVDPFLVAPTEEQTRILIQGDGSIHYAGIIGRIEDGMVLVQEPLHRDFEKFVRALRLLKERGAVFGEDYIVTCYEKFHGIEVSLHTKNSFLSEEDFA